YVRCDHILQPRHCAGSCKSGQGQRQDPMKRNLAFLLLMSSMTVAQTPAVTEKAAVKPSAATAKAVPVGTVKPQVSAVKVSAARAQKPAAVSVQPAPAKVGIQAAPAKVSVQTAPAKSAATAPAKATVAPAKPVPAVAPAKTAVVNANAGHPNPA